MNTKKTFSDFIKNKNPSSDREKYWNNPDIFSKSDEWIKEIESGKVKVEPIPSSSLKNDEEKDDKEEKEM